MTASTQPARSPLSLPVRRRQNPSPALLGLSLLFGAACSPEEPPAGLTTAQSPHALSVTLADCLPASLITAITQANTAGGASTITLMGGCTYTLTVRDNFWYGPNGLPPITADITIDGTAQGAIIERSSAALTPSFRLFYVAGANLPPKKAGKLTLSNLTLRGGLAQGGNSAVAGVSGGGGLGAGGAVFVHGEVVLSAVTVSGNIATGGNSATTVGAAAVCSGGGGLGGNALGPAGGGFRNAINNNGGNGVLATEGGRAAANAGVAGVGGTDASGAEPGLAAVAANGGAGGGTRTLGGTGAIGSGAAVGGVAGDGGGGGGGRAGSAGGGGGGGFGGNGGNGGLTGGGGGGAFGGGGGASAGNGGGGAGGVGGGGAGGVAATAGGGGGGGFGGGGGGCLSGGFGGFGGGGGGASGVAPATGGTGGYGAGTAIRGLGTSGGGGLGAGGALFIHGGNVTLINSTLTGNQANGGLAGQTAVVTNRGGGGSGGGGAVFNLNGTVTVINSTLASNTISGGVGGKSGTANGGALYSLAYGAGTTAVATVRNSILSNSTGGPDLFVDASKGTSSADVGGQNIVMTSMTANAATLTGTPLTADPLLMALAANMGPASTMALGQGSPAIAAGDTTICSNPPVGSVDERGQSRSCSCDLGAFAVPVTCSPPDLSTGGGGDGGSTGDGGGSGDGGNSGGSYSQISGGGVGCSAIPGGLATAAGSVPSLGLLGLALALLRRRRGR